jgi:replicative DNA helicase
VSELARKPPQAIEAEAMVLGAMLLDPDSVPVVLERLAEDDFYVAAHRKVFRAVGRLFTVDTPCDIVTVGNRLRLDKDLDSVGGTSFLTTLVENVLSVTHVEEHCDIVKRKAVLRKTANIAARLCEEAFDADDPDALLSRAQSELYALQVGGVGRGYEHIKPILKEAAERAEARFKAGGNIITGLSTGYTRLDEMTCGFQPGDLVVLAGRSSQGKTALALNIGIRIAKTGNPVSMLSLEQTRRSIGARTLAIEAKVPLKALKQGQLTSQEFGRISNNEAYNAAFWIDDTPGLNLTSVRLRCRRAVHEQRAKLIIIDHLGQIVPENRRMSPYDHNSECSRGLKLEARHLNIPILLLTQLSRGPEKRNPKHPRPMMSDLRDSGRIEEDADLVMLIYRDEFYNPDDLRVRGIAEINMAKQREGDTGKFLLTFIANQVRFENYSKAQDEVEVE